MSKAQRAELLQFGLHKHRSGDLAGAIDSYRQVLAGNPADADALNLLGVALHQAGDASGALDCLRRAVRSRRRDPTLHYNLGTALLEAGDHSGAESALREALKLGSRDPHLEMNLANAIALQGRLQQALPLYEVAARRSPRSPQVWFNYGNALRNAGELERAVATYRKAVELAPELAAAWVSLGNVLHRLQRVDEAEQVYRQALAMGAGDAAVHCGFAQLLLHQGRPEDACPVVEQALLLAPDLVEALALRADILRALHRFDEAEASLTQAAALDPRSHDIYIRLADLMRDTERAEQAVRLYESLPELPQDVRQEVRLKRALACMQLGRYTEAWQGLQERLARELLAANEPRIAWAEQVLPAELEGKTVYVTREQGLGDELLYLRFLPPLRARGARVLYRCGQKLQPLLDRVHLAERIDADLPPPADADYWLSVGDLPWALEAGARSEPTPAAIRLQPLAARVQEMRRRLAAAGPAPYIGLTWRAGTVEEKQRGIKGQVLSKRIEPAALGKCLQRVNATLVVLQRGLESGEIDALTGASGRSAHDFGAWNEDLDDALALLAALDDYCAVSNTNMHLAAGIGRGARVLLDFPPNWRWFAREGTSAFFPGFLLYAQDRRGSWDEALSRLQHDLEVRWGLLQ